MSKYEFVISAKDKTAQAFGSINNNLSSLSTHAKNTATSVAGVTASFVLLANNAVNTAKELDSQATLASETVEEFQALSYAFKQFNIDQEKFADLSKDVQDKLGDFLATGAGPFADFFEKVAPKVGLTADVLRDLSSTDVLIAVKKAMDDANVSAKEQVFYMEAIANDATLLIPALEDSGKKIKSLAQEYRELNLAISQTEIDKVKELSDDLAQLEAQANKLKLNLAAAFVDPLTEISTAINEFYEGSVVKFERDFIGIDKFVTSATLTWYEFLDAVGKDVDPSEMDRLANRAEYLAEQYDKLSKKINGEPIEYSLGYGESDEITNGLNLNASVTFGEVDNILEQYPELFSLEGAVTNISVDEAKVEEAAKETSNAFMNSLNALDDIQANVFNFDDSMLEGSEQFWSGFEERGFTAYETMYESNQSFWDQWLEASRETLTDFDSLAAMTAESFSRQMGNVLEEMLFDSENLGDAFQGAMQSMARSTINAVGQMAGQWLAYQIVQMAVGKSTAAASAGGMALTAQAQSLMAGLNAFTSTAAIPVVGPAAAPAAMGAALKVTQPIAYAIKGLSASAAVASFDGGGLTPDAPRIGGMDGKGGKLAMLHPREKVIDLTRSQSQEQAPQVSFIVHGADMSDEQVVGAIERAPKKIIRALRRYQTRPF